MPLDQVTKDASLIAGGLDPSKFDIDEMGNVSRKVSQIQPTINPKPVEAPIIGGGPSPLGSFGRSAAASALPTAAGLAGGVALPAAATLLAPETGGLSLLALSLLGGMGASYGAGKVQNSLMPKSAQDTLALDEATNPIASRIGGFAPAALAFNPVKGLAALPGVARSIPKAIGPAGLDALTAGERMALGNTAINVGTATGQNIYEQSQSPEPFSLGSLGMDVVGGALLNEPSGIGKSLGFHSGADVDRANLKTRAAALVEAENNSKANASQAPKPVDYATPNPISGNAPLSTSGLMTPRGLGPNILSTPKSDATRKWIEDVSPKPEQLNTMEGEGGIKPKLELSDWDKAELEKASQDLLEQRKAKAELDRQEAAQLVTENSNRALELKNREAELQKSLVQNQVTPTETQPNAFVKNAVGEETSIPTKDYTGVTEQANKEVAAESPADLAARKVEGLGDKYQEKSPLDTANWDELPSEYKAKVASIAAKRGITLQEARSVTDAAGNEKLGVYQGASRTATISGPKGRADTVPHEIRHSYLEDLKNSGISGDRMLYGRAMDIAGGNTAKADELLAMRGGLDGYNRIKTELEGTKLQRFESFYKDFVSRMKYKLGMAKDEDVMRVLSQRQASDAPYGMRGEIVPKADRLTQLRAITNPTEEQAKERAGLEKESQTNNSKDAWKGMGFSSESAIPEGTHRNEDGVVVPDKINMGDSVSARNPNRSFSEGHGEPMITFAGQEKSNAKFQRDKVLATALSKGMSPADAKALSERIIPLNTKYQDSSAIDLPSFSGELRNKEVGRLEEWLRENSKNEKVDEKEWNDRFNRLLELDRQPKDEGKLKAKEGSLYEEPGNPKYASGSAIDKGPESVDLEARKSEILGAKKIISPLDYKTFGPTRTLLDNVRLNNGTEGNALADSAAKTLEERDSIRAKYVHPIDVAYSDTSKTDRELLKRVFIAEDREGRSYRDSLKNEEQRHFYDAVRESLKNKQEDQIKDNQPVFDYKTGEYRLPKVNPNYFPSQVDTAVLKVLQEGNTGSNAFEGLKKDFVDHQISQGNNKEVAEKMFNDFVQGQTPANKLGLKGSGGAENYFKANRISEGVGLPDSWLSKGDVMKDLNRYFSKAANDRAFYRNIESNPDVAKSIGLTKDAWDKPIESSASSIGGKDVNALLETLKGRKYNEDVSTIKGLNRVATALMLGPLTNAHIAISSLANIPNYIRAGDALETLKHTFTNFGEHYENTLKTGYARKDYNGIKEAFDNQNSLGERLGALANGINTLSGRGLVNHVTKGLLQGASEFIVDSNISRATKGDSQAKNLLKQIDPKFDPIITPTPEQKIQLASNLAGMIHGMHDARTLPRWMLHDSAIQPFFSLASWNIAQTNNFMRNVYTPATKGNFEPLLMATLGASIGGYVLKEIREKLADKKSPIPAFEELSASSKGVSGNIPLVAYNLMAMSSMAGYGGILSSLGKVGFDVAYKNMPQGYSFPLNEAVKNVTTTTIHAAQALMEADSMQEYLDIGTKASVDLAKENVQLARLVHSWVVEVPSIAPEAKKAKDVNAANRDLRAWKMAEGMPYQSQQVSSSNPYEDMDVKSYKKTDDVEEAAKMLPSLISKAVDKSDGNPEVLKKELEKIKSNSFQTLPNPDEIPVTFMKYVEYLRKTKGDKAANERIQEYFKENFLNKMKASMVPSF